jgi:hypothetical protein
MGFLPFLLALQLSVTAPVTDSAGVLCVPSVQVEWSGPCLPLGPGEYAREFASARVPASIPELPLEKLLRYDPVVEYTYARVTTPDAPLFASIEDAAAGTVKRSIGKGFIYVNLVEAAQAGDQVVYKIRSGEFIRAADVSVVEVTKFQGVGLTANASYSFGWIVGKARASLLPGAIPPRERPLLVRRSLAQIFATQRVGEWDWYLIGPNEWIEQRMVAKVDFNPPPAGVSGKWVQVNLYEQTMAAYEDGRMVYATLVSSGLDKWATEPGLFHIWARLKVDRMSGSYEKDGSDYYALEAVPWVMYFDGSRALHGEYWHDRLGFKRSHGCVNLAPLDARWLFAWAEKGTPVWVYDPSGQTVVAGQGGSAP